MVFQLSIFRRKPIHWSLNINPNIIYLSIYIYIYLYPNIFLPSKSSGPLFRKPSIASFFCRRWRSPMEKSPWGWWTPTHSCLMNALRWQQSPGMTGQAMVLCVMQWCMFRWQLRWCLLLCWLFQCSRIKKNLEKDWLDMSTMNPTVVGVPFTNFVMNCSLHWT